MAVHTIEIERSIEDVFAVLTDVTKTGRWYPAKVEEWWVTPPPHGVGSVRRARVMVMGRASENDAVVTRIRSAATGRHEGQVGKRTVHGHPGLHTGTRRHARGGRNHLRAPRPHAGVGPLFIGPYERGWDKGLQNLKRMMEAGELDPAPPASASASA